jgi:hypothetical protein
MAFRQFDWLHFAPSPYLKNVPTFLFEVEIFEKNPSHDDV